MSLDELVFDPENPCELPEAIGEQRFISASKILNHEKCAAYYLWRDIYKIEQEGEDCGEQTGHSVHSWHEGYFKENKFFTTLERDVHLGCFDSPHPVYSQNLLLAELRYMYRNGLTETSTLATEYEFHIEDKKFTGKIDRIELRPDGNLTVVEVKPSVNWKYPKNQKWQLTFYAWILNYLIKEGLFQVSNPNAKVTHGRIIGYKDASEDEFKINTRTINTIIGRIDLMRTRTEFPRSYGQPLCRYCEFETNLCTDAALVEVKDW